MAVTKAVRAQFEEVFGFPPPDVLVERGIVNPRRKSNFLPSLEEMLAAENTFADVLAHCAYRESVWPVAQLFAGCFEISNDLLFVHVTPDGDERVVWWDQIGGFSRPVGTNARLYLAADEAFHQWSIDHRNAPFLRAVDAARDVCDWPEWPPIEWVETFGWTEDVAKLGPLPALPKSALRAGTRTTRGLWLAELLVRGSSPDPEWKPSEEEATAKPPARIPDYMPDIVYWLWHSAVFGDDETRARVLARARSSRSRMARDAGEELHARLAHHAEQQRAKRRERAKASAAKRAKASAATAAPKERTAKTAPKKRAAKKVSAGRSR